jgi:Ser/Thr protein kinase RdoA (MazF antagonist)
VDVARESAVPYAGLTPDRILDAVESVGYRCDGRLQALNSYENRVYQVGLDDAEPVVVKFYRPGRWPDEAIMEEHAFASELAEHEIPAVPPLAAAEGRTLHEFDGFRLAVFPKLPGRNPELEDPDTLRWMGRFMGRIHAVGATRAFAHRPALNVATFGEIPFRFLMEQGFLPAHLETPYRGLV